MILHNCLLSERFFLDQCCLLLLNHNAVVIVAFDLDDLYLDYKIIKYAINLSMWREKPDH